MKNTIACLLTIFAPLAFIAQIKQERAVTHFSSIHAQDAIQVVITMSGKEFLVFEAEESVMPKLKAEVRNGALYLSCTGNCVSTKGMTAYVNAKELSELIANDASSIRIINGLTTGKLFLDARDASDIELSVETDDLKVQLSDASTMKLKGHAKKLTAEVKDASSFKSSELMATDADLSASDASSIKCHATGALKAVANDASTIIYSGEPKSVNAKAEDASTIKKSKT